MWRFWRRKATVVSLEQPPAEVLHSRQEPATASRSSAELHAWVQAHQAPLYRYCLWLTDGRPEEAADICQEAFLRVMTAPPFPHDKVRAWLKTAAWNVWCEHWRKSRRAVPLPPEAPEFQQLEAPEHESESSARARQRVKDCLARLAPLEQRILALRHPRDETDADLPPYSWRQIARAVSAEGLLAPSGGRGRPRKQSTPTEDEISTRANRAILALRECVHRSENPLQPREEGSP